MKVYWSDGQVKLALVVKSCCTRQYVVNDAHVVNLCAFWTRNILVGIPKLCTRAHWWLDFNIFFLPCEKRLFPMQLEIGSESSPESSFSWSRCICDVNQPTKPTNQTEFQLNSIQFNLWIEFGNQPKSNSHKINRTIKLNFIELQLKLFWTGYFCKNQKS